MMTPERIVELRKAASRMGVRGPGHWASCVTECLDALEEKGAEAERLRKTLGGVRGELREARLARYKADKAGWFRDKAAAVEDASSAVKARLLRMADQHDRQRRSDVCQEGMLEMERSTLHNAILTCEKVIAGFQNAAHRTYRTEGAKACIDALQDQLTAATPTEDRGL